MHAYVNRSVRRNTIRVPIIVSGFELGSALADDVGDGKRNGVQTSANLTNPHSVHIIIC